jgi:predicted transcriptional regulator
MTLTIELPPATLERLKAEAAATGKDVQTLVGEAVEARFARRRQSFAEILKPIHVEVEARGISEQELESLVDDAARETRLERRGSQKGQ